MTAIDNDGKLTKIGDRVLFKEDYEGQGIILNIKSRQSWSGTVYDFTVGLGVSQGTHIAERWDYDYDQYVVYTDEVWKL